MPEQPLLSVVTPVLNQAAFLDWTLRSVRAQAYPRIEHIVIDGGSTDGSLDLLQRERDAGRLRLLSEPDHGMYDAINKGLRLATGDVLAYLNSDDAWLPWAVETVMRVFQAEPGVDMVFGDGIKVDQENGLHRLRLFPPFDRVSLANYESLMQPAVFWRRGLYERMGGFEPELRFVGDLDYWLRAAATGARIRHLSEVIAVERIHDQRLSSASREQMAAEDRRMRDGHRGTDGAGAGRRRALSRDVRWQRWLWVRFLIAYSLRPLPGPWARFAAAGRLTVRPRRVLLASQPGMSKRLWGTVTSDLATETLGLPPAAEPAAEPATGPARGRRLGFGLERLATLALALPALFAAGWGRLVRREWDPTAARPTAAKPAPR